jgi:hypothetical protein
MSLVFQYEESKKKFEESLPPEEKHLLEGLSEIEKGKLYNEYFKERVFYE